MIKDLHFSIIFFYTRTLEPLIRLKQVGRLARKRNFSRIEQIYLEYYFLRAVM
jgi:hypothetical protein